jgi:hypothetical protein
MTSLASLARLAAHREKRAFYSPYTGVGGYYPDGKDYHGQAAGAGLGDLGTGKDCHGPTVAR